MIIYQGWKPWILLAVYLWWVKGGYTLIGGVLGRVAYVPDRVPRTTSMTMLASLSLLTAGVRSWGWSVVVSGEW